MQRPRKALTPTEALAARELHTVRGDSVWIDLVPNYGEALKEFVDVYSRYARHDYVPIRTPSIVESKGEDLVIEPIAEGTSLFEEVNSLRARIEDLEEIMRSKGLVEFARPRREEVIKVLLGEIEGRSKGDVLYPSDIASKFNIDPDIVEDCMDELVEEGKLVTRSARRT